MCIPSEIVTKKMLIPSNLKHVTFFTGLLLKQEEEDVNRQKKYTSK